MNAQRDEQTTLTVQLPVELDKKLAAAAKARLTSKSTVVREILLKHVLESESAPVSQPEHHKVAA